MGDGGRVVGVRRGRVIRTVPGASGFRVEHGLETVQVIGFDATTARYPVLQIAVQFPLAHIACAHILLRGECIPSDVSSYVVQGMTVDLDGDQ